MAALSPSFMSPLSAEEREAVEADLAATRRRLSECRGALKRTPSPWKLRLQIEACELWIRQYLGWLA